MSAQQIRAAWFACTVGTAAGCMVFDTGRRMWAAGPARNIVLFLIASIVGGMAGSRYTCGIQKWLPCLVIGLLMTVRLYDPFLGPPPAQMSVQFATLLSGSIGACFGNSLV